MKPTITQLDDYGCGAACVAYVANCTYQKAVTVLGVQKAKEKGFYCRELVDLLAKFNRNYTFKHIKPKLKSLIYREGVIVFIQKSNRFPYGHYLARQGEFWMDPWINLAYNNDITQAKSGYRHRLPGKVQYALLPII